MKTKSFILLFFLLTTSAFAQLEKEKKYKWQIGVNINTVEPITEAGYDIYFGQTRLFNDFDHQKNNLTSFGLNVSYMVQENFGIRLSAKSTKYKVEETYNQKDLSTVGPTTSEYIIDTGYVKQSAIVFSPGIFWNFKYKKLNLYSGFQIVYRRFNPAYEHLIYRIYNNQTDTLVSHRYYDIKLEGGYSIGIAPFIGFSANIFKGISVGAEFTSAYSYYKTGGELTWIETRFFPNALTESHSNKHTYEAYKFSSLISSFNISYTF